MASRSRRQRTKTKHYTDDDPTTFTTKEKRGETPPPDAPSHSPVKKRPRPVKRSHRRVAPPPQHVSLSHHVRMVPLFNAPERQHSVIIGRGLGIPPPLQKPEWEALPPPLYYFPQIVQGSAGINATPVVEAGTASCSCITTDDNYLAIGDTAGFVSIYTLQPKLLSVAKLDTTASARERSSNLKLPPSKKFRLYEKKSHPNQIDQVALAGNRVVLSTKHEVELVDVRKNQILWSFPLDMPCHSLDIHMTTDQVLCSFSPDTKNDATSPLWLLDGVQLQGGEFKGDKALVQPTDDAVELSLGHRCAAIWDKSNVNYILMVTLVRKEDGNTEQDLLKLDKTTFKVVQQTGVPNKPSGKSSCHTVEFISQSPSGHLTLVSSTKGIRMLETSSLQLLRVFGDSVALHGHSLTFQQCLFIPKPTLPNDMDDWLEERENRNIIDDKDWASQNAACVMGVPFANREPRELRDTLHVWELWDGKHTSSTLLAPPKSEGFRGVEYVHNNLIAATQAGDCFNKAPTVQSDFPGIMYPAGYQVINDNLEYIEDEDEVDVVMTGEQLDEDQEPIDDDQMAEAVRLSMIEQHQTTDDVAEEIDVVGDVSKACTIYLPCHPEPLLSQIFHDGSSPMSVDPHDFIQPKSFASSLLITMPHASHAAEARQEKSVLDEPKPVVTKAIRVKRSKAASLETLLKSSLDLQLRKVMMTRQLCAKGFGSRLDKGLDSSTATAVSAEIHGEQRADQSNGGTSGHSDASNPVDIPALSGKVPAHAVTARAGATTNNDAVSSNGNRSFTSQVKTESTYAESDAAAALLMSASGELDSPSATESVKAADIVEVRAGYSVSQNSVCSDPSGASESVFMAYTEKECFACKGRWVFHSCGKKAKPVDYDEILKAEEEKREQEEEEKRKARAEKRRIADAKRREARKKKKLEEDARFQREEMERIRFEKEHRQQQLEKSRVNNDDKDRRRVDMLQRLQAEQTTVAAAPTDWPPPVQSYGKLQAPSTYQSYSTSWPPQPAGSYDNARDEPRQASPYAADWPAPANHSAEQSSRDSRNLYSSEAREWPHSSHVPDGETNVIPANSHYRGVTGWPEPSASATSYRSESHEQSSKHGSTEVPAESGQLANNAVRHTQYPSSYYRSPAAASEEMAPSATHATQAPKATFDTIDPAEALASLAMFAIAAPKVEVHEDYHRQSVYPSAESGQPNEGLGSYKEEQHRPSQEYQSNGWSNSNSHSDRGTNRENNV